LFFFGIYFLRPLNEKYIFEGEKVKGISFVAPPRKVGIEAMEAVKGLHSNWISLMPYGFVPKNNSELKFQEAEVSSDGDKHWWGESPKGIRECIRMAHEKDIKVMVKPHIWLGWNEFTGHLSFKTESDWLVFEKSYKKFLLAFAKISEEENAEMFCIATEMQNHIKERPEFWYALISDIRKVYKGKLTYAENWDVFEDVPFWSELDFIGIDGYFPLSKLKDPDEKGLMKGWKKHVGDIADLASSVKKPVLFTEIGYRSCDFSTEKPWEVNFTLPANEALQAKAYKAFFSEVWNQPYFAGAFIWKWFPEMRHSNEDSFTPQGKKAEQVLREHFAK
jgi:hypothetical protein